MPRCLRLALAVLALAAATAAQEIRIRQLEPQRASAPADSLEWFAISADLIEAWLDVDAAKALALATEAWQRAQQAAVPGAVQAMAAMAEFATTRLEGPTAAKEWRDRTAGLPTECAPVLAAWFHVARARSLCAGGEHVEELDHALPGQAAAERAGDPLLQLRAFNVTLHATPSRDLPSLRRRFEAALAGPHGESVETFEPWILLDEYLQNLRAGSSEVAHELLDRAEAAAQRDGNRRALGTVHHCRGRLYFRQDPERALTFYERASDLLRECGDRQGLANSLDARAVVTGRTGDFARAEALLSESELCISGRGFTSTEDQLLDTQIELAVRSEKGDRAARLMRERDRRRASQAAADERVHSARQRLAESEAQAAQAAHELELERARMEQQQAQLRTGVAIGAITVLALLAALSWHGRRRLQQSNAQLAREVERVREARRDQAALEKRLRDLERAQGLGTMAAGVAHDFNNLLTGIVGSAELIAEANAGTETATMAAEIRQSGRHAARLCKQLQTYAGGTPIDPAPVDLIAALRSLLPVLRSACRDQVRIRLVTDVESLGVVLDASALDQALLNLVTNARDAKATSVTIRVEPLTPAPGEPGVGRVRIDVVDDGEGMPPEVAARVFDPFFTTRFPGRGLGLAVVSGIVQRHGGRISVQSEPGRGSTFRIELPGALPPVAPEPTVVLPSPPPVTRQATLLAVDDDENVRTILTRMLRVLGQACSTFADGESLLAAAAGAPTNRQLVLFVDLTMPGVDGTEVLRRVRERRPDARFVLMSGHAEAHLGQVTNDLRPDRVLPKPFQLDALRALLGDLLASPEAAPRG